MRLLSSILYRYLNASMYSPLIIERGFLRRSFGLGLAKEEKQWTAIPF